MPKRRFSNVELANYYNDPNQFGLPVYGGKLRLTSRDRLLIENGGSGPNSIDLYYNLLLDEQVYYAWDKQVSEITSRDWYVEPGGETDEDQKAADFVKSVITNMSSVEKDEDDNGLAAVGTGLGIDGLTRGLAVAMITGISIAEVIWYQDVNYIPSIKSIKVRDPRRFFFETDQSGNIFLKLLTKNKRFHGIYVPAKKFIVHRYYSVPSDDPYGAGIGRMLYYPVQWKRELLSLWLSIVDKYSDPTVIGKYDSDITEEDKKIFDQAISNIARDMAISMPTSFSVEFANPSLSSPDLLANLEKLCNAYISKVIMGESNTGEREAGGVMKENVSNSIRVMKAKALSDHISETMNNTVIRWLSRFRYPTATPPKIWRNFDDVQDTVELLNKLKAIGYKADDQFIQNLTGIPKSKEVAPPKKSFI